MFGKKKEKEKVIIPLYKTLPLAQKEKENGKTPEEAVEMAKKWVEEHRL
ncbi:MAG: hypothetical protein IJO22_00295 [Oscillospiraceae bacterium]|nr:hypothetical protein [Oscillospiraceae bacterium]